MGAGGCLEKWARDSRTFPQLHDGAQHLRTWKPSCVCCLAACTPPAPVSPPVSSTLQALVVRAGVPAEVLSRAYPRELDNH